MRRAGSFGGGLSADSGEWGEGTAVGLDSSGWVWKVKEVEGEESAPRETTR